MGRVLVAGKNDVEGTFLIVPPVNQIEAQPGILLVEFAAAHLVNDQTRGTRKIIQSGCFLAGLPGNGQFVPQF